MECQAVKKLIPEYSESSLSNSQREAVKQHLLTCSTCQKELRLYEKSWEILTQWKNLEPAPGYISRFWTKLSLEKSWKEKIFVGAQEFLLKRDFAPVRILTLCTLIVFGVFYFNAVTALEKELAGMDIDEIEFVENVELAEYFDVIEDIDFLEDMEIIENLDQLQISG